MYIIDLHLLIKNLTMLSSLQIYCMHVMGIKSKYSTYWES